MSRRHCLSHAALAGCLIVTFSVGVSLAQENQTQQQPEMGETQAIAEQDAAMPVAAAPVPYKNTNWNEPECSESRSHHEADLCQQRRMAKAAEDAVFLSKVQTGAGIIGALLIFGTLAYTIKTANATVDAAKVSRASNR